MAKSTGKKTTKKTAAPKAKPAKASVKKAATKTNVKKAAAPKKKVAPKPAAASNIKKTVKAEATKTKAKTVSSRKVVEVISPTKKVRKVKGYSKKELESLKDIILVKRDEIIEQLQSLKEQMMDPTTGQYVNESSPYSLHMAEQGTDAQEREKLYLWAQRENKFLGYLEDALQRIENGTYGICIECIDEPQNLCATCPLIPIERLKAVPHTQHCLQIKQKMQSK